MEPPHKGTRPSGQDAVSGLLSHFFRISFTAILAAALAVGVGLLVAYEAAQQWPPRHLLDVIIAIVAAIFAYAIALTVLVSEALKALLYTTKETEKQTYTVGNLAERGEGRQACGSRAWGRGER